MKTCKLDIIDCYMYRDDIFDCYQTNRLVFDSQNPIKITTPDIAAEFIRKFVEAEDSCVMGLFDDSKKFLYGLVIFDNIRYANNKSCAQVHIVNSKTIFGKVVREIYDNIIAACGIDTIYAEIPAIAVFPINICKRLGFVKTGYIPEALPYINSRGQEKMYDIIILTYKKKENI